MSKYNNEIRTAMLANERSKKGTGANFFSSKEDNANYFNNSVGTLKVVGLEPIKGNGDIKDFNVVMFDDGHQMSTSRFFSAKGIKFPVGGNVGKLTYLVSALEMGKELAVTPKSVTSSYIQNGSGQYYVNGAWVSGEGKNIPAGAAKTSEYTFENVVFPKIDLIDMEAE